METLKSILSAFAIIRSVDELPYWQQEARRHLLEMRTCHFHDGCTQEQYGKKFCACHRLKLADFN